MSKIKYRVTRNDNRYEGGPDPYFKTGDVVVITGSATIDAPDLDGEVFADLISSDGYENGYENGYVRADALEPVREFETIDPPLESALEAALYVLGLTLESRLTIMGHAAVADLAAKIKETREALNG